MQSDQKNKHQLIEHIQQSIVAAGGWLPFDRFMALALYAPDLGYYTGGLPKIGMGIPNAAGQTDSSDFVTAPHLSPLFGHCVGTQVQALLSQTGSMDVWEFGAGTGLLAKQVLTYLNDHTAPDAARVRYHIVDLSGHLQSVQRLTLAAFASQVQWHSQLPDAISGVVLGNELLDAMPVQLLHRVQGVWHERGVQWQAATPSDPTHRIPEVSAHFAWSDRPTSLRPPVEVDGEIDYLTEIHPQAEGWVATIAAKLLAGQAATGQGGAMLLIDYGFPESEYYHSARHMGTLMCHQAHRADDNPLIDVGRKDITAHVNFTGVALAGQDAGLDVLGYTSQGRFLINAGFATLLDTLDALDTEAKPTAKLLAHKAMALKLIHEHEMGELFKVICLATPNIAPPSGFAAGDRTHRL